MGNSFASVILSLGEWGWEIFCLRDFFRGGRGGVEKFSLARFFPAPSAVIWFAGIAFDINCNFLFRICPRQEFFFRSICPVARVFFFLLITNNNDNNLVTLRNIT